MHLLLVADGRSPITRRWIQNIRSEDTLITLISTYPCTMPEGVEAMMVMPVAFAGLSGSQAGSGTPSQKKNLVARFRPLLSRLRYLLGPLTLPSRGRSFARLVSQLKPDVVHALRIPYEGMLASYTPKGIPLILSTWGNDLTLHAPASRRMSMLTRRTLQRADALMADCSRDIHLAQQWGFDPGKPSLVVVGNGGLDLAEVQKISSTESKTQPVQILNPRGMRNYVRNDTFFKSVPLVLSRHPEVHFVCASMAGQPEAEAWLDRLNLRRNVTLLPFMNQPELWQEFARSTISVSISTHDGTPNSLLEAMAFGCLPVCGDLESIREWITPGVNGLLVDPSNPQALADALCLALETPALIEKAAQANREIIQERAEITSTREHIRNFYLLMSS